MNLADLFISISKHRKLIFIVTFLSAVTGGILYFISPKTYEAKSVLILRNPLLGDRNNVYNGKLVDYFASEDDVNKVLLMSESDIVQTQVIKNSDLAKEYKIDGTTTKGMMMLKKRFNKNLNVIRAEYLNLILTYTDTDPDRAANVANETVRVLEKVYGGYYWEMRTHLYESLKYKIVEEDSSINALTDTLYKLRDKYGIYDIISPARHNIMISSGTIKGGKNLGKGIEEIQNVEAIKDELVSDHAVKTTLINEYKTSEIDESKFPMIKVITEAKPPTDHKGFGAVLTIITSSLLGFFFCTVLALITDNVITQLKNKATV